MTTKVNNGNLVKEIIKETLSSLYFWKSRIKPADSISQ